MDTVFIGDSVRLRTGSPLPTGPSRAEIGSATPDDVPSPRYSLGVYSREYPQPLQVRDRQEPLIPTGERERSG